MLVLKLIHSSKRGHMSYMASQNLDVIVKMQILILYN